MKRKLIPLFIALNIAFNIGSVAAIHAQDVTIEPSQEVFVTNTPAATEVVNNPVATDAPIVTPAPEPQPEPPDNTPSDRLLAVFGLIIFATYTIIKAFLDHNDKKTVNATLIKFLDDKRVQDEARQRYAESSMTFQQFATFGEAFLRLLSAANLPGVDDVIDKAAEFGDKVISPNGTANLN